MARNADRRTIDADHRDTQAMTLPPGIHMAWPAVAAILATLTLLMGIADRMRARDVELLQNRITAMQTELISGREDHQRTHSLVMQALYAQSTEISARFNRVEARLDALSAGRK